jgi:hypothetical protein
MVPSGLSNSEIVVDPVQQALLRRERGH